MTDEESMDVGASSIVPQHQNSKTYTNASIYNMSLIKKCYGRNKWCDLTLTAESRSFHTHRIVLCAAIPYFDLMLNSPTAESKQAVIRMEEISAHGLATFIDYAYTGSLNINVENVASLLLDASYFLLDDVRDFCKKYILEKLNSRNCLHFLMFNNFDNWNDIGEAADLFAEQNFSHVMRSDDFLQLDVDAIVNFLVRDKLCVESESELFEGTIRWVRQSVESRMQALPRLINCIRLTRISRSYLITEVLPNDLIRDSVELTNIVKSAIDTLSICTVLTELPPFREGCLISGGIYLLGERGSCKLYPIERIEIYRPGDNHWFTGAPVLRPARDLGLAMANKNLYAFSGQLGYQSNAIAMLYNMRANQWYNVNSQIHRRSRIVVASLNDHLYLCGGVDNTGTTSLVEKYSTYGAVIRSVMRMRMPRCEFGVATLNGYLYVVGGRNCDRIYTSVERYDPRRNRWRLMVGMRMKRCQHGVAELGGRLYACGGYDGICALRQVECYDPKYRNWFPVRPMINARQRHAVVATAGRLWAIGGCDNNSRLSSVESYDPRVGRWSLEPSMHYHSGSVTAAVLT